MDDWRSRWKGRTTITVADFILLTFDIDPATVEQQPASGYRTEQILDAIQHSGLASGLGYDQPVHKLLRPTTGRQAENELREHATNRLLYFKDAVAFAVECGQWEIPEWLQATYRGTTVPFEKHRKISAELQQALDRIAELEAEVMQLQESAKKSTKPSLRAEATDLNIIGGLLDLILNKASTGKHFSGYANQTAVILELLDRYEDQKPGIKKRTLEDRFSRANKSLAGP